MFPHCVHNCLHFRQASDSPPQYSQSSTSATLTDDSDFTFISCCVVPRSAPIRPSNMIMSEWNRVTKDYRKERRHDRRS